MIKKIFWLYSYIFFRYYKMMAWLNRNAEEDMGKDTFCFEQALNATLIFSIYIWVNFLGLSLVSQRIFGYGFDQLHDYSKIQIIMLGSIFGILNIFILLSKKRYKKIINQFKGETKKQMIVGNILVAMFGLFSLGWPLLFLTVFGLN